MPWKLQETSWRISFCQDPQHCGIFLQAAFSDSVYIPECCLLAVLWRNSELRVEASAAEWVSDSADTLRLWIFLLSVRKRGAVIIMVVRERFLVREMNLVRFIQWYFDNWLISVNLCCWTQKSFANWLCGTSFVLMRSSNWICRRLNLRVLH